MNSNFACIKQYFRRLPLSHFPTRKPHSRPRHHSQRILVKAGDDLKSLAQKAYGNSSLWYVLAAANALSGDSGLIAGTQLKVPEVGVSKNDAGTFKPYNPNEIVGSTSPSLPYIPTQASNGCSAVATLIRVAVAVVIAFYAPQASYAILIAGGGEAAAQTVEINQGYRDGYDVGAIVVAGISAGVSPGGKTLWGKIGFAAAQAVGNYNMSYLVNKALGHEASWNWRGVASTAVSAAMAQGLFGSSATQNAAGSQSGSMIPANAPFSWSRVAQAAVTAANEAGKSVIRSGIGYAVDKAIIGEAHWNWGQVMSSAAVQAGSAFGGAYRQSGVEYNALKSQGLNEQDARMMAWGERVNRGQGQAAAELKPQFDALDPNGDDIHDHKDLMYFSASNAGTYALPVTFTDEQMADITKTENPYIGLKGLEGVEDDGVVCRAPEEWQNKLDLTVPQGQLTFDAEGGDNKNLRNFSRVIHWPGEEKSGVTLGRGYDMGLRTLSEIIRDLTNAGIDINKAKLIAASAGLKGEDARIFVRDNKNIIGEISRPQQKALFELIYPKYLKLAESNYNKWTNGNINRVDWSMLKQPIKDVMVDFVYQGFTKGPKPMEAGMNNDIDHLTQYIIRTPGINMYEIGRNRAMYLKSQR